ncbi:hypothetical protein TNCV_3904031 [Trichonephila clavipes]|nr:hypothetical protein TNCV_3904031 [Trichonephila clavipes]
MWPLEDADKNGCEESGFQLCPDDHRRRVWRAQYSVPILLSLLHATQALNQELWPGVPFLLTAGPLWSSFEAHLSPTVRRRHSENCFATVPFAVPWPYFSEDKARPQAALSYSLSNTSLARKITRSLFNRACLGYDRKATASTREC